MSEAGAVTVLALTRAVATGDTELFDKATEGVGEDERALLLVWLREAISERWSVFSPGDAAGFDLSQLTRMRLGLSRLSRARPRLAVRVALGRLLNPTP